MTDRIGTAPPGQWLRWIADRFASPDARDRVLMPLLADLQHEHASARGRLQGLFVRARGSLAFWNAFGLTLAADSPGLDLRLLGQAGLWTAAFATAHVLYLVALANPRLTLDEAVLCVPALVVVTMPAVLLFHLALRQRPRDANVFATSWSGVVVLTLTTFAVAAWINPAANQAYRERVLHRFAPEWQGSLAPGDREMGMAELARRAAELRSAGRPEDASRFDLEWHKKPALALLCLAFALAGVSIGRLLANRVARSMAGLVVFFVAYALLRLGEQAADSGAVPAVLGAWAAPLSIVLLALFSRSVSAARSPATGA